MTRASSERGSALVLAMLCMALMAALGAALVLSTTAETMIAGNYRSSHEGAYAADAVLEYAIGGLSQVADWNEVLDGDVRSAFVDGPPGGTRTSPGGTTIDLAQLLNMANCNSTTACSDADMNDTGPPGRPWGANNPRWQLYAYGPLAGMLPGGAIDSPYYVIALVADDPSENDSDPRHDGAVACAPATSPFMLAPGPPIVWSCDPGASVLSLRAEAFGPRGGHNVVEATVARTNTVEAEYGYTFSEVDAGTASGVRVLSWREVR